ncbi:PIG-L deacetylase family protein [Mycolicibacterium helvum]|uniref:Acetylglucosaminylphosphatidylinositol deacetylase n=1 Tax=Mycolicibacterium helvum TaxID=1534349 RepID=A0A7I7TDG1_9MYCO|nr:PIG-L family deacetylase [Mycolicibacterium helvum]BBY66395.1 acetylglucosaminylphosphatidylinositol deacetylase [Mycolicibacterium helvum]
MSPRAASNAARFADVPIAGGGTPTQEWLEWGCHFPPVDLDSCPGLLVVAPHPDDETLGFGGAAGAIAARGIAVRTVVASDGGAAWPGLSSRDQTHLERARRSESRRAASALGLRAPTFLGLPDGGLADEESRLADILTGMLDECVDGTWCAATWRGDGHPDHEAVGRAAAVATSRTGAVLLEYPVWMWHWARPGEANVPWQRASRVILDPVATERKQHAVAVFRSQLDPDDGRDPIVPPHVLSRLQAVGEVVFR